MRTSRSALLVVLLLSGCATNGDDKVATPKPNGDFEVTQEPEQIPPWNPPPAKDTFAHYYYPGELHLLEFGVVCYYSPSRPSVYAITYDQYKPSTSTEPPSSTWSGSGTTPRRIELPAEVVEAILELVQEGKQRSPASREVSELSVQCGKLLERHLPLSDTLAPGELLGTILTAGELGDIVELSLGSDDGIGKGALFAVRRDEKVFGAIRVLYVSDRNSVAKVIRLDDGSKIQPGDMFISESVLLDE